MATVTRTRNLKLKITSDLTLDAKANLEKIDTLGSLYQVDTNSDAIIRSIQNISLLPQSSDLGGLGVGGEINLGASGQPTTSINLNTSSIIISDGVSSFTTPTNTGALVTTQGAETLVNKTINASLNTVTNITNSSIAAGAAIDGSKIVATFGAQSVETTDRFRLSNGTFTTYIKQASSGQTSNIGWELPATDGTSNQVLSTDGTGKLGWANLAAGVLSGLADVNISGPTDGQLLTYDSGTSKWVNEDATAVSVQFATYTWSAGDGFVKTINHGFNTYNLIIELYDENHVKIEVGDVYQASTNSVILTSSTLPGGGGWMVLIQAVT